MIYLFHGSYITRNNTGNKDSRDYITCSGSINKIMYKARGTFTFYTCHIYLCGKGL